MSEQRPDRLPDAAAGHVRLATGAIVAQCERNALPLDDVNAGVVECISGGTSMMKYAIRLLTLFVFLILTVLPAAADSCDEWMCAQRVDEWGAVGAPYCEDVRVGGMWVTCAVKKYCMWVVTDSGMKWTCTPYDCQGETCMWV